MAQSSSLLSLGGFTFSVRTAAYQKMDRQDNWRWVTVERLGQASAEQYIGPGTREISLTGTVYTGYNPGGSVGGSGGVVGTAQIAKLRALGDAGIPHMLVGGSGGVLGLWVIVSVQDAGTYFTAKGAPLKQEFTVNLRAYGGEANPFGGISLGGGGFGGLAGLAGNLGLGGSLPGLSSLPAGIKGGAGLVGLLSSLPAIEQVNLISEQIENVGSNLLADVTAKMKVDGPLNAATQIKAGILNG